jgi:accessory colonization factor AcfC
MKWNKSSHISLQISRQNEKNLKSTNMRPIIIIIQIQNMNIKLNMEDISKGTHQMQIF